MHGLSCGRGRAYGEPAARGGVRPPAPAKALAYEAVSYTHLDVYKRQILDASQLHPDRYDNPEWKQPEVVIVWGNEPLASNPDGFVGHWLIDLMRMGTKFIVMDPALTWLASKADIWIQVRPGTD